jgi:hypothetical protein
MSHFSIYSTSFRNVCARFSIECGPPPSCADMNETAVCIFLNGSHISCPSVLFSVEEQVLWNRSGFMLVTCISRGRCYSCTYRYAWRLQMVWRHVTKLYPNYTQVPSRSLKSALIGHYSRNCRHDKATFFFTYSFFVLIIIVPLLHFIPFRRIWKIAKSYN